MPIFSSGTYSKMAAPMKISGGKLVFQKSHFNHPTTQHEKCIADHWFNAAIDVTIPDSTSLPTLGLIDDIDHTINSERYCYMLDLPVATLVKKEFIEAFVKRGRIYLLSQGQVDAEDCVCIIPTGQLILSLTKDTYETLGLEGKQSQYNLKSAKKYGSYKKCSGDYATQFVLTVITLELLASHFKPGREGYDRVRKCLEVWGKKIDCFIQWKPDDDEICPSSLPAFLTQFGTRSEKRAHKHSELKFPETLVPVIAADDHEASEDDHVTWEDFYDWLGCRACGIDNEGEPGDYVNTYVTPEPNEQLTCLTVHRYSGFISSPTIVNILKHVRQNLQVSKVPWLALTVHGFHDAPVTWKQKEHGYLKNGDNFYTFVLFPDQSYWLIQGVGALDVCP